MFASGKYALGKCKRCNDTVPYSDLLSDGYRKWLRVCPSCYDEPHPAEKPFKADDASILAHPAPDIDDDSPGDSGTSLATAFGWGNYFGGNT